MLALALSGNEHRFLEHIQADLAGEVEPGDISPNVEVLIVELEHRAAEERRENAASDQEEHEEFEGEGQVIRSG